MRRGLSRRALLHGSAAAVLLGACAAGEDDATSVLGITADGVDDDPETIPEAPLARFPLGIASGDASATGMILWARYAGTSALYVAVWEMIDDVYQRVALAPVTPGDGGFALVDIGGLRAGARHRYAFLEIVREQVVARSPIGRVRTAFADDALLPLTVGAVCCTANGRSMATLERAGERGDLDVLCMLGDATYNDGARTRDDFRGRWAQNLSTAGYRGVRAAGSVLATWDDHEVANNWNPETVNQTTLATATAAFFEHLPIRRSPSAPDRIYRSARWGLTAELFVLDCRSERRPSTRTSSNAQYLSRAQMDWLKERLAASPAVFKLILNSVPITDFPGLFDTFASDRWEGYPAARRELLSYIVDERIDGVLWLAGDFHLGSAGRVAPAGGLGSDLVEILAGPGDQLANPLWPFLKNRPQFDFATGKSNYTSVALDPATRGVRATFRDGGGGVIGESSYTL